MRPAPSPNVWSPPANGGCYDVCDFKDATSRLVVRGVSCAPEILSACSVRPGLAGFGGGVCLHCDGDDDECGDGDDNGHGHSGWWVEYIWFPPR